MVVMRADQGRDPGSGANELGEALRHGPFELAIKLALRARGLSLERLEHHLAERGLKVSASSLSNWQTGRSRPERSESIRVLNGLEQLFDLPPNSFVRLLGPQRPRGRWMGHVPGSVRYGALFDDHARLSALSAEVKVADDRRCLALSVQDRVTLRPDRRFRAVHVQQVITALVGGVDGCLVFYHAEDGPLPEIVAREGCRLGRARTDRHAGIAIAELLFDCDLDRDDIYLVDYEFRFGPAEPPSDYYYRAFRNPCRQYLLQVRFAPVAQPVRCFGFSSPRVGVAMTDTGSLACHRGRPAHLLVTDHPPGIVGIRWEWT